VKKLIAEHSNLVARFASMDNNADRIETFLAAHPGQFYCDACLSIEALPALNRMQVSNLTRPLHDIKPYRRGTVGCISCNEVRECIAYGCKDSTAAGGESRRGGNYRGWARTVGLSRFT